MFSKKLFDFLHNRTVKSVNRLRHQSSTVVENNVRFLLFCLFTDKLYKSLLLHILFVNDFPCICLAFYQIATLIQNQVAALSFWCQKAIELYQCFFVHIVKCGLSCRCDCDNVTDTKFSDFEFVGIQAFHVFTNFRREQTLRCFSTIADFIIVRCYHKAVFDLIRITAAVVFPIFLSIIDLVDHKHICCHYFPATPVFLFGSSGLYHSSSSPLNCGSVNRCIFGMVC